MESGSCFACICNTDMTSWQRHRQGGLKFLPVLSSPVPAMVAQVAAALWPPAAPLVSQKGAGGPEGGEAIAASRPCHRMLQVFMY